MNKGPIGMTPTPWAVCDEAPNPAWMEGKTIYCPAEGKRVADTCVLDERCVANAAYIVLAVNSYARLVKVLEDAPYPDRMTRTEFYNAYREWLDKARAVLVETRAANPEKAG